MLTSHQMESANSSNSPRIIIQGVATSRLVAGWSTDCKPPRVNRAFVHQSNPFRRIEKNHGTNQRFVLLEINLTFIIETNLLRFFLSSIHHRFPLLIITSWKRLFNKAVVRLITSRVYPF